MKNVSVLIDEFKKQKVKESRDILLDALRRSGAAIRGNGNSIFCPFHKNENTEAAGAFIGKDGEALFTCQARCGWNHGKSTGDVFDVLRVGCGMEYLAAAEHLGLVEDEDKTEPQSSRREVIPVKRQENKRTPKSLLDEMQTYRTALTDDLAEKFATELGVSAKALRSVDCGINQGSLCSSERSGKKFETIVGIHTRWPSGKKSGLNHSRGLTIPVEFPSPHPILILEGMSDCAASFDMGTNSIGRPSNSGGTDHLAAWITDHPGEYIVMGENDQKDDGKWPGKEGAITVATTLSQELNRSIRWALPPEGHKDVRTFKIAMNAKGIGDKEAGEMLMQHVLGNAEIVEPSPPAAVAKPDTPSQCDNDLRKLRFYSPTGPHTELWAARKMVYLHGNDLRYCKALGWLVWNGVRWERDDTGAVYRKTKDCIRQLYGLASRIADENDRKAFIGFVVGLERRQKIDNIIKIAESEDPIPIRITELDRDLWLLNTLTGVIDLRTGELREHDPRDLITKLAPIVYDPAAKCPTYDGFLESTFSKDKEMIAFTDRAIGHALTGAIVEAVIHVLHGIGANGKSTLIELILYALGNYAMAAPPGLLIAKKHETHPTELADLRGMRFVAATETGEGARFDEEKIKKLTGGDTIKGRYMHKDFFEFPPTHKLFLATNHKPDIRGSDHAIWRRPKLWPFNVKFVEPHEPGEPKQDQQLRDKLRAEAPGILARWVRGCKEWQRIGLKPPAAVTAATADYKAECDRLEAFIQECCTTKPSTTGLAPRVGASELYAAYKAWAEKGIEFAFSQKRFGMALKEKGFQKGDPDSGTRRAVYVGIDLLA